MSQVASRPATAVELSVACLNLKSKDLLSQSDPLCILYVRREDKWHEVGRTEQIDNDDSPRWQKKFIVDYFFEERQEVKFEVYDWDKKSEKLTDHDYLGKLKTTLGAIVAARGRQFVAVMQKGPSKGGQFVITAEEVSTNRDVVRLHLAATGLDKKDTFSKSDPVLIISKVTGSGQFTPVHKTEVVNNSLNPEWHPFSISVRDLCNGDYDRNLQFEVFDWDSDGKSDLIGGFITNLRALSTATAQNKFFQCINPKKQSKKNYKNSGEVFLKYFMIERVTSFMDYIQAGTNLNFSVAIDFTASNGHPRDPNSLHFRNPKGSNQYTTAIRAVGSVIQDYDSDKNFPALGFGAKIPPHGQVSHEFFLNLQQDNPFCAGVTGILAAYYTSLQHVQLHGPTNFAPIIKHNARLANAYQDGRQYFAVLIITDGEITDLDETKAAIVEASLLPMSIIIIGVGNADFRAMEHLDADRGLLKAGGRTAVRDIVQFVELRKFLRSDGSYNKVLLSRHVLAELPRQMVGWMTMKGVKPLRA